MELFNPELETVNEDEKKLNRVREAERKKALKEYQPTDEEVWETGYETHTGSRKAGIYQMKLSDADKRKLDAVKKAIDAGELTRGVDDMKKFNKTHALKLYDILVKKQRGAILEDMVKRTPSNYILAMDEFTLGQMFEVLKDEPIISVDTETTGLNLYGRDKIVGVSFTAPNADLHWYIPLRHDEDNAPFEKARYYIEQVLTLKNDKVLANAIFDLHQLRTEGLEMNGEIHDVQIMMKVLNENEPSYKLKDLVSKYLKIEGDNFDKLFGETPFNEVALKYARYYACKDTHITWLLYVFLLEHLKKQKGLYNYYMKVEQPLTRVVFEMERQGFIPILDEADKVSVKLGAKVETLKESLIEELGDINLNSPKQLLPALKALGLDLDSTAKDELKKNKHHPTVSKLLEYRKLHKLNKDFISKIRDFIQPDGKVHGTFNPNGARTGRFSSKEPNLQQIPPEARTIYRVDDDSLILGLDFKAQEPRMLAHYTQEPILVDNYTKGRDLYATLASEFYGKSYEECYKTPDGEDTKERKTFKVVVLAIMYGMGGKSLGNSLGIKEKEAQAIIDKFYVQFPKVAQFVKKNTVEACRQGFVEMKLGDVVRKRRLPFFRGKNPKYAYDTFSTNAKIQGTTAIQTKLCMIEGYKLCQHLSKPDREFAVLACIHDELLYKVPKDITREEVTLFENIMTDTVKLNNIPSGTDGVLGNCWGNLTPVDKHFEQQAN
ncbi:DNA polymerase [Bacillus sp. Bos-x628]|uniref:DNA polymerase n=1 Tax=Bacillus maqinnsis TaxID=3229854 RepID=UPI00338FC6DF